MLYEQSFIDDLKTRADLVRIIEPYAPLKKKARIGWAVVRFIRRKLRRFPSIRRKVFINVSGARKAETLLLS
jgi:DNA primase